MFAVAALSLATIVTLISQKAGVLTAASTVTLERQVTASIGESVTLPCVSNLTASVDWQYHRSPFEPPTMLFSDYKVYDVYETRFRVARPTSRDFSLTVVKAELDDSGMYTCIEDGGLGKKRTISLLVEQYLKGAAAVAQELTSNSESTTSQTGNSAEGSPTTVILIVIIIVLFLAVVTLAIVLIVCLKRRSRQDPRASDQPIDSEVINTYRSTGATSPTKSPLLSSASPEAAYNKIIVLHEQLAAHEEPVKHERKLLLGEQAPTYLRQSENAASSPAYTLMSDTDRSTGAASARSPLLSNTTSSETTRDEAVDQYADTEKLQLSKRPRQLVRQEARASEDHNGSATLPTGRWLFEDDKEAMGRTAVRGICVFGDQLYVARDDQPQIDIYNKHTMQLDDRLPVTGQGSDKPCCMAGDTSKRTLYITYYMTKIVRRVQVADKSCIEWRAGSEPDGVAVMASHNVLVTLRKACKLVEFEPNGQLIKTTALESPVVFPRFAMPFGSDQFLVCFGFQVSSDCGLCLVNAGGKPVKMIDSQTAHPLHLASGPGASVFVSDLLGQKVVMLDGTLNCVSETVRTDSGVGQIFRVCCDEKFEQLFVGEFTSPFRVLSFNARRGQ